MTYEAKLRRLISEAEARKTTPYNRSPIELDAVTANKTAELIEAVRLVCRWRDTPSMDRDDLDRRLDQLGEALLALDQVGGTT